MRVGWTFVLNTEKPATAKKLVNRVNGFLGTEPVDPSCEKYYKGGYRYSLHTDHDNFDLVRKLLDKISYNWGGVSWGCLQGSASSGIRITGVTWVTFWISDETSIKL
jgi:hypothetical protein